MDKIEILKKARHEIESGRERFICHAISKVVRGYIKKMRHIDARRANRATSNAKYLCTWIQNMLCAQRRATQLEKEIYTYEFWVTVNHYKIYNRMAGTDIRNFDLRIATSKSNFRQGRLQWMDWMISELSKKKDKRKVSDEL